MPALHLSGPWSPVWSLAVSQASEDPGQRTGLRCQEGVAPVWPESNSKEEQFFVGEQHPPAEWAEQTRRSIC